MAGQVGELQVCSRGHFYFQAIRALTVDTSSWPSVFVCPVQVVQVKISFPVPLYACNCVIFVRDS